MPRNLPRRKKQLLISSIAAALVLILVSAGIYWSRRQAAPYVPGQSVEGIVDSLGRHIPEDHPRVTFADVAAASGINFRHFPATRSVQLPEDMGSGASWGDYDGDGDLDLFLCNFAAPLDADPAIQPPAGSSNKLYRNRGDGTFEDVTEEAGLDYRGSSMGAAWGDYDSDGDLDLLVTTFGDILLYENREGTFQEVAEKAGMGSADGFWSGASWGDYDGDGDLDLYVCGYVQYHFTPEDRNRTSRQYQGLVPFTLNPSSYEPQPNLLFENLGRKRFREVARQAGVDNPSGRSLSAAWADFNLDGRLDLYVANDISDNAMYLNLGQGKFQDISHPAFVADYRGAMGLGVGDWDNDGDLDLFVSHWIAQENALLSNLHFLLGDRQTASPQLTFMDLADQVGLGQIALDYVGWGTSFFDYDNDGLQDLFVANGSTFQEKADPTRLVPMRNLLFWNKGQDEGFFEVGEVSGSVFQQERVARGTAFADYDGDGDVDILVVNHGAAAALLQNQGGNSGNWLTVRVRSAAGNRFGLGARVELQAGDLSLLQQVGSQPSYLSAPPAEVHFGLGPRTQVDRLVVTLPDGSGRTLTDIAVNQVIVVEVQ